MTSNDFVRSLVLRAAGLETLAVRPRFIPYFAPVPAHEQRRARWAGDLPRTQPPQMSDAQEMPAGAATEAPPAQTPIQTAKRSPGKPDIRKTAVIQGAGPDMKRPTGEEGEGAMMDDGRTEGGVQEISSEEINNAAIAHAAEKAVEIGTEADAKNAAAGYGIASNVPARVDDVAKSKARYPSDDKSNASTTIAGNASDDAQATAAETSREPLDYDQSPSPGSAKVLPISQSLRRGQGGMDQFQSLESQIEARSSDTGSSAMNGSEMARPKVSSDEDLHASSATIVRRPDIQEKPSDAKHSQRPEHFVHSEEAPFLAIPEKALPGPQMIVPEKAAPQAPGTVQVRIGTVEVHADGPPPAPTSRPRPSGFQGYEMIRNYVGWEH